MDKFENLAKAQASVNWLKENFKHIWFNPNISVEAKAGFLAASCHPHRCYLMTLDLRDRIAIIINLGFKGNNPVYEEE